jgi:hypothetical protein
MQLYRAKYFKLIVHDFEAANDEKAHEAMKQIVEAQPGAILRSIIREDREEDDKVKCMPCEELKAAADKIPGQKEEA